MRIFFATDGSPSARWAQAQIAALPWRPPVHVTAMTVLELPGSASPSATPAVCRTYEAALCILHQEAENRAVEVLASARRRLEPYAGSVATRLDAGPAGATIVDMARACRADLVAVGSRGLGPYKGFLLGSVSRYVARYAGCPVLVAKAPPTERCRLLVALDGTRRDRRVLEWLKALDLSGGARIHIAMIVPPSAQGDGPRARVWPDVDEGSTPDAFRAWARSPEALETLGCRDLPAGVARVTAEHRRGQGAPEILDLVRSLAPQLLILGAKAWRSPAGFTLGRVAGKLIELAGCSILIVRP